MRPLSHATKKVLRSCALSWVGSCLCAPGCLFGDPKSGSPFHPHRRLDRLDGKFLLSFSAAGLLTPDWLKGPHHLVQDEVVNDGAQHHFVVSSEFGTFPAVGVPMLRTRVIEIEAIAALKDARQSEVFVDALKFQLLTPSARR